MPEIQVTVDVEEMDEQEVQREKKRMQEDGGRA
jgi:hypothetical protein